MHLSLLTSGRKVSVAILLVAGCSGGVLTGTPGTGGVGPGTGGVAGKAGPGGTDLKPENLISDFEQTDDALVVMTGTPPRSGSWYTYNDDNLNGSDPPCVQSPPASLNRTLGPYLPEAPPSVRPGSTGALALHARWSSCTIWGAGIGASLNWQMGPAGTVNSGTQLPYDVSAYGGMTFWAMATPGSDSALRIKLTMTDETQAEYGGTCVESSTNKCNDDFGERFILPANGTWQQITVRWTDPGFVQEGWGAIFPWNPAHVLSVQIQSVDKGELYDFWIDDLYFIN